MAKPAKFTVDDGVEYATYSQPPSVRRAIAHLDGLPFGALLTLQGLAAKIGVSVDRMGELSRIHLKEYRKFDGLRHLYGHPKTLKALNEQEGG